MTIQPERGAINTTDSRVWTDWYENPFRALRAATEQQEQPDAYQRMLGVMRESTEWQDFDARNFLDDVLQEIGGATNYVVQYGDGPNIGKFRATLDA